MEILKQILLKPLLVLLLIIQCAFVAFIVTSVPKDNERLQAALSGLRTPSQSNIALLTQNDAREIRLVLERQIDNHKSFTTVCVLFGLVSIALMVTMILPFSLKQTEDSVGIEGRLRL